MFLNFVSQLVTNSSSPNYAAEGGASSAWNATLNASTHAGHNGGQLFRADGWLQHSHDSSTNTAASSSTSSKSASSQRDLYEFGIDSGMRELELRLKSDLEEHEKLWDASTGGVTAANNQQLPQPSSVRH